MVAKELDYIRSKDQGDGSSTEKNGGVYSEAFEAQDNKPKLTGFAAIIDSFKRVDDSELGIDPNLSDTEKLAIKTANAPLNRRLKSRHLQMIAIGGSIGTGLFVGSGGALVNGGPAGVLIAYFLIGIMMYCTVQSLGNWPLLSLFLVLLLLIILDLLIHLGVSLWLGIMVCNG